MRAVRLLAVALLATSPLLAAAVDAPHEAGRFCSDCHMGHNAPGVALTNEPGNVNLCQSCHVDHPDKFGFDWADSDQAVPGESGISHRWDALATNRGATPPVGTPMADKSRLADGKLQCSTCHDQHKADALMGSPADPAHVGSQHTSYPVDEPQDPTTGITGGGTLTLLAPAAAAAAKGYLVEIVDTGSATTATFRLSNDNGTSWFGCSALTTYTYVPWPTTPPLKPCQADDEPVPLNDEGNVTVAFTGAAADALRAGDRWGFYVSYPYLRVSNKDGAMCTTCHKDRNMTWQNVEGESPIFGTGASVVLGTTVFSHPVGQALRAPPSGGILEPNGDPQATGDDNPTNDLVLGTGGRVTCTTCHHPHNADSNSISHNADSN